MAADRRGRWFDPELVDCLQAISSPAMWASLETGDLVGTVAAAEPAERAIEATGEQLDQIATAFAWVIDAKSSFTFEHSDRVTSLALAGAARLGFTPAELTRLRRAALLHVLQQVPVFRELADDAANHHERIDGRGYFRGLKGDRLTPAAKILAVADVADALMSERPYRAALPIEEVIAVLMKGRGTQFWPDAVEAMAVPLALTPAA